MAKVNKSFNTASAASAKAKRSMAKVNIPEGSESFSWNDNGSEFVRPDEPDEKKAKGSSPTPDRNWQELDFGPKALCPPRRK